MIPNVWTKPCDSATCVEVAWTEGAWLVRDSKDPDSLVLSFDREEWAAFVSAVKAGVRVGFYTNGKLIAGDEPIWPEGS